MWAWCHHTHLPIQNRLGAQVQVFLVPSSPKPSFSQFSEHGVLQAANLFRKGFASTLKPYLHKKSCQSWDGQHWLKATASCSPEHSLSFLASCKALLCFELGGDSTGCPVTPEASRNCLNLSPASLNSFSCSLLIALWWIEASLKVKGVQVSSRPCGKSDLEGLLALPPTSQKSFSKGMQPGEISMLIKSASQCCPSGAAADLFNSCSVPGSTSAGLVLIQSPPPNKRGEGDALLPLLLLLAGAMQKTKAKATPTKQGKGTKDCSCSCGVV